MKLLNYVSLANLQLSSTGGLGAVNIAPAGFNLGTPYAFSPTGTEIAFPGRTGGASYTSVYKMNVDGTGATQLVPTSARAQVVFNWGAGGILYKDWDGAKLTFPLWVVDPVSLVRSRLSPDNWSVLDARWSPDGSKIAFVASERLATAQPYALYVKQGGGTFKITTVPVIVPNSVSWAPTGDRVAVSGYAVGDATHYKVFDVSLNLATNTGIVSPIVTSTTTGSTNAVWWGDLSDPTIPTTITTVDVAGQYSETVTLQATLQESGGVAMAGASVTFNLGGVAVGTATTNASGVATLSYNITNAPGTYTIAASYSGSALYSPATTSPAGDKSLTVTKAITTVTTANQTVTAGDPLTLSSTLSALGGWLPGKSLVIKVDGVIVSTQTTNASGAVSYTYTPGLPAGTYPIDVSFAGDANYAAGSATTTLTVTKAPVTLTADDQTIDFGNPVTLTATMVKTAGLSPIAGESVQFKVNGTVVGTGTTNASGIASYSYTPSLAGGTYPIVATFAGSGIYQATTDNATLTVTKAVTTLTPTNQTITYGQPVTLSATLMAGATPVAGATVQFKVGATVLGNGTTNASGVATYAYTPNLAGGTYTITATYAGDTFYNSATGTATLTVNKAATAVAVANATTNWGSPVNLTATLTTGGSPLAGRLLAFKVDGTAVGTATTNAAGVATLSYTPTAIPPGNHTITVDFGGDTFYLSASGIGNMVVNQAPTILTAADVTIGYNQSGNLTATLLSGATPVSGKAIQFQVNGTVVGTASTNASGVATLAYTPALAAGTYTIDATFAGDVNYVGATDAGQLTVTKASTALTAADQTIQFGNPVLLSATLTSGGSPVAGKTVTFKVNGTAVGSGVTNASGVATYGYTPALASGAHTIDADWAGDGFYLGATDAAVLTVTKALTTLVADDVTLTYGVAGSLTATLTENGSGNPVSGRSLAFKVNGTAVGAATTNASGVATLAYTPNLAAGPYTILVDFAGDGFYNPSTDTASLTVTKAATAIVAANVTVTYGQAVNLTATLTTGGTPVSGKTVAFKVNGAAVGTATTNAAGLATLPWSATLAAGTYPIVADFAGDSFYLASTVTATATVNKAATALLAADVTVAYGQSVALTATLTSGASPVSGKPVQFQVNGTAVGTATTNAAGVASLNWTANLAAGTYTIDASFAGDGFYVTSADTASATVTKAPTAIATADVTVPFGSAVTLQATLTSGATPVAGKTVTFTVNGTAVGSGTTNGSGVATFNWTATLAAGTYPLIADFAGDGFYVASSATKQATVTKPATTIVAADQLITYGQPVTLSATLTQTAGGAPISGKPIEFKVDGTIVGTGTTDGSGVATYSYTPNLPGGAHTIDATFVADAFFLGATDAATLTVNKAATTLVADDQTVTYGQSVNLTATLTAGATPVAGKSITFKVNGAAVGSATTNGSGVAALPWTANLAAGTYTIDANFAGDTFYLASADTATATVNKAATAIVAADVTVAYGQSIALTATLTSGATPVNGKTIQFAVNGTAVGTATTNASGVASLNWTANLAAGSYTIDATFAADGFYLGATDAATATVTKAATAIATADVTAPYGSAVTLSATLTSGASPVAGRTVTFKVNGTAVGTGTTDATGKATLSWTATLAAGNYALVVDFAGDGFYLASSDTKQVTVTKPATTIIAADQTITYGQPVTLSATLTQTAGGAPVSGKSIQFKVGGTAVGTGLTDAAGVATYTYTPSLAGGTYVIDASFAADAFFLGSADTATLTVNKAATTLTAADVTATYSQSANLTATLVAGATPIAGRTIAFKVNGTAVGTATTNASGVATLAWTVNLAAGTYTIDADFTGDTFYLASTDAAQMTVNKATTAIVAADVTLVYGQTGALTATLTNGATPVSGKTVAFQVNGVAVGTATTNASGVASLSWTANLASGTYTIDAAFAGDTFYLGSTDAATLTVNKAATTIATADVTAPFGSAVTLSATLTSGASPVVGKTVTFKVNGTAVGTGTTNASGVATFSWTANLAAGNYPLIADYAGDTFYLASSDTKQVTVTKPATTIVAADVTAVAGTAITLSATLTQTAGGAPIGGKPVEFKVNGSIVGTGTTNGSGVATFGYTPALGAGTYTIDATFLADPFYLGSTDAATLTLTAAPATIAAVDVTGTYNSSVNLTATLTSGATPVAGKLVTFKVGGTTVGTATTNASGVATLAWTINLAAGVYTIDAIWAGDPFYGAATDSTHHLTVTKAATTLVTDDQTTTYGQSVNLTATLTSGATPVAGKSISFKVNGTAVGSATTNASGVATLAWTANLAGGTYTITSDFAGDGFYLAATDDGTLTLNKAATTITTANVTVAYGSAVNLTATLKSGVTNLAGKTVTFKVNGTAVGTATTNASGVATLSWTANLAAGNWPLVADFAGDPFYLASTDTKQVTITKPATAIVADDKAINALDPVTLTATLTTGGSPLAGKPVDFKVNGALVGTGTTNAAGVASYSYTPALAAGTYTIDATFVADAFYLGSTDAASLVIAAVGTTLVADDVYGTYGQTISLTATLTRTAGGASVSGKVITFQVNGTNVGTATTDASGVATLGWTVNLGQGAYPINATFAGDTAYAAASGTATATIDPAFTTLTTANVTGTFNQSVNLTATLMAGATPVAGKMITFRVNGTDVGTATTNASGVATLPYLINVAAGTYTLQVLWPGDTFYDPSSDTAILTVNKAATAIVTANQSVAFGATASLTATLTTGGSPLAGKTVEFRVNGALVGTGTTNAAGVASYNYSAALPAGTYTIDATFPGDGGYLTSTANATLTITKPATAIVAANQTVTAGLPVSLTATLTSGGNPVAGKPVEFKVNGAIVGTATTNGSGVATYTYIPALPAGTYTIDATFVADAFYQGSTGAASLVINAAPTVLLTANVTATYGTTTNFSATLTSGGSPVAGKVISFTVNGTNIGTATTNGSGVATFTGYNVTLAGGTYPIVVSFAGDGYYGTSTDNKTLTVNKAATVIVAPDLSVEYGASAILTATLTAGGSPLVGRTVTFKNGAAVLGTGTTDAAGLATFSWAHGYNAGTVRTLTAEFAGDSFYNLSTDTLVMTVVKANTTLAPTTGLTVQYNMVLNLTGTLTRTDNTNPINAKPITFKVNGGTLAPTQNTNASGVATYAWTANLAPGTYSFDVGWPGDANYNGAGGTTTLTVTKRTRTLNLTATVNPVQYSDTTTLTATLSPAQSGVTVTFKQGATVLGTGVTDAAGVATLTNYQIPWPAGSYPVTADVVADAFNTAATGNLNLTVNKETVTFTYTGDVSVEGSSYPFVLQSTLVDGDGSVIDYGAGNVQVRWTISGAGFTTQTHTATVDATGKAQKSIFLQKRAYNIVAEILVNGYIVEQTLAAVPVVSAGTGTGLWGSYYEDYNSVTSPFTGMVLNRLDAQVNFNWGASNPEPTVFGDSDTFSVRWTGYIEPLFAETYEFCVNANDGVRFWFNGTQQITQWTTRANAQEFCWTSGALSANFKYPVTLEYFDDTGNAEVQLRWRTTATTHQLKVPIQKSQLYPEVTTAWKNGLGLTGRYYNSTLGGTAGDNGDGIPELIRNDANLYYSWDAKAISPLLQDDEFYVKWTGKYIPAATHGRLWTYSDDGVRVRVKRTDNTCGWQTVINNWTNHAPTWNSSANNPMCGLGFIVGLSYDIEVEFYENTGLAWIWLSTTNNGAGTGVIPQSAFRVELMPATPTGLAGNAPASDRVNLNWTANPLTTPQVSGYVIFRSTTTGFTADQTTLIGSSNTTTFTDFNRDPATTYYYKIAAIDTAGNISGFTAEITVTTP